MRTESSILHVDLDAFFASVEQRDKPSLRGRPVVVGGLGPRGVVATASYEARAFGVHSAMSMAEARARCPHAAFLAGRFDAYRAASESVMATLREISPRVESLSLDEAFVDLADAVADLSPKAVRLVALGLKERIHVRTSLTASVGAATTKLIAKIASDLDKPDGLVVVEPGAEVELLRPMSVRTLWGVGPATAQRLARLGVRTIADLQSMGEAELVDLLGQAHGQTLYRLARADDDRAVVAERESKSVSVEDTFERDVFDRARLGALADGMSVRVCGRLKEDGLSGRTVTLKVRLTDFTTMSRSATLAGPTDDHRVVSRLARRLLEEVDTSSGVRLLGVGVSGLADWVQDDLFAEPASEQAEPTVINYPTAPLLRRWIAGMDVVHQRFGQGWVWGSGLGRVTVRFETRESGPGPVRTLAADDPDLTPAPRPKADS